MLRLPAPAKLNLFLRITGRRADGYHELQTLFQLLDWGDELELHGLEKGRLERAGHVPGVPAEADLSLRAARLLQERAQALGRPWAGARITLHKAIPLGSGLGGASSDAATVLLGLNALWGSGFSRAELTALGARLGADVPVFVQGDSAWAEGVGERLSPLALGERHYVLLLPGAGLATREMFADPELRRDAAPWSMALPEALPALENDFLPLALKRSGLLRDAFKALQSLGPARMSGSGSTLFLEAMNETHANELTTALKNNYNVRAVRGVDRSPVYGALAAQTLSM